jgi:hypothetical protein
LEAARVTVGRLRRPGEMIFALGFVESPQYGAYSGDGDKKQPRDTQANYSQGVWIKVSRHPEMEIGSQVNQKSYQK